jgi:hypothetical protein
LNKNTGKLVEIELIVDKGKSHKVARNVLKKYRDDIRNITTTIGRKHNVIVGFVYRDKQELQDILRDVKAVPYVKGCSLMESN